jgi:hypothetical protein
MNSLGGNDVTHSDYSTLQETGLHIGSSIEGFGATEDSWLIV